MDSDKPTGLSRPRPMVLIRGAPYKCSREGRHRFGIQVDALGEWEAFSSQSFVRHISILWTSPAFGLRPRPRLGLRLLGRPQDPCN